MFTDTVRVVYTILTLYTDFLQKRLARETHSNISDEKSSGDNVGNVRRESYNNRPATFAPNIQTFLMFRIYILLFVRILTIYCLLSIVVNAA